MKNLYLVLLPLLISVSTFSQQLISIDNNIIYQDQSVNSTINGYNTHFGMDSTLVVFYNNSDTLSFWKSFSNDNLNLGISSNLQFKSTGFYDLLVFNNTDDTMKLHHALYVFPSKNNPIHLFIGQPYFAQTYGQHLMIFNGSNFPHFNSNQLSYGYFFNAVNQILVDSIVAYNESFLHVYFQVDSSDVGLYNFLYFNDVDSFLYLKDALWVQNNLKTCIKEVVPDSMTNISFFPDTVYIKGNQTHFTTDTNYIGFTDPLILSYGYMDNVMVVNDSLIKFELYLPMPVKIALYPNLFITVYNPSDGLLYYPLRIDFYGEVTNPQQPIQELKLFPNPTFDAVSFQLQDLNSGQELNIEIFSFEGKSVQKQTLSSKQINKVEVSELKSGIYFLVVSSKLKDKENIWVGKFVKQ